MRVWLSGPRILGGLIRPGISLGREDVRPHLPSWRRYEYREALKAYAAKRGQPMTNAEANHDIDKAAAMGDLDAAGPVLRIKGSREEIIEAVLETSEKFGIPVTRAHAEQLVDKAIRRRFPWAAVIMAVVLLTILVWAVAANANECCEDSSRNGGDYQRNSQLHDGAKCFNEWGERGTYYGQHCYIDSDD